MLKTNHDDTRHSVEEVVDKKEQTPSSDHWLLADHIVQPLLVTQQVSPHKAVSVILILCVLSSDYD